MRRENSTFNLNFLSEPGTEVLHNNDYFGSSVLEGFACYVVADGLRSGNDKREDPSARLAGEAVIAAFNESPSISRRSIAKYMEAAHKELRANMGKDRRRASITVVVTNYQKLRYGWAGNCRFNLYRSGRLIQESRDHSLSWQMMEEGNLPKDKIAFHAERHNLETYCGTMRSFSPGISRKIKLKNADVFALFTRGIWENADTSDMLASVKVGENDPAEASRHLERLVLDRVPVGAVTDNYTNCFVFVDKVFIDPERKKRIKRIIIISIIALVIIAIIIILIIFFNNRRNNRRQDMEMARTNGIAHIEGYNFIRARQELATAYDLAVLLRDSARREDINNHILLVDAVIFADEQLISGNYQQAIDSFGTAYNRSRYADNLAMGHIERRRGTAARHLEFHDYMLEGDSSAEMGDLLNAQAMYLRARSLASRLHYTQGRAQANQALESLHELRQRQLDEQMERAQAVVAATQLVAEGDRALQDGDIVSALLFYQLARDAFIELGDFAMVLAVDQKIALVDLVAVQNEHRIDEALDFIRAGDDMLAHSHYTDARRFYQLAREIFLSLGDAEGLRDVTDRIELLDLYLMGIAG